jgi:hypothetical protein
MPRRSDVLHCPHVSDKAFEGILMGGNPNCAIVLWLRSEGGRKYEWEIRYIDVFDKGKRGRQGAFTVSRVQ